MKIVVIGTGYVGLVSGTCFADIGVNVTCVDKDSSKINSLKSGQIPIYEPGLDELVIKNHKNGRLQFTTNLKEAITEDTAAIFIAVGTPPHPETGDADLKYVFAVAEEIAETLNHYAVIITKSTVPVGTGPKVREIISKINPNLEFDVASNPEFLREGSAIGDFMEPDRVVVGANSDKAHKVLAQLYKKFSDKNIPVLHTDIATAEMIKYAANSFLATKIGFINEIADICEKVGANIAQVSKGMGMDTRIGDKFLMPGPGCGGSCFPKDTLALSSIARSVSTPSQIVDAVIKSNNDRKANMAEKIITACKGDVAGKNVAIWGLTFKANTDDMRESPSLPIISALQSAGANLSLYDPEGMEEAKKVIEDNGKIIWCDNQDEAVNNADCLVIITEWSEFKGVDISKLKAAMKNALIVDLRNLYEPKEMGDAGFEYHSVGRVTSKPS